MKRKLGLGWAVSLACLFPSLCPASSPSQAIPYAAELIQAASTGLVRYLGLCLDESTECGIDERERALLEAIRRDFPRETTLQFATEAENPGFFETSEDSPHRLAVTGDEVGDPIYINWDRMNDLDFKGAVAMLVHELGHHHGVKDTPDRPLDRLGAKVAAIVEKHSEQVTLAKAHYPRIGVRVQNRHFSAAQESIEGKPDDYEKSSQIFLFDGKTFYNYHAPLARMLPCPVRVPERAGFWVTNLYLEEPLDPDPVTKAPAFSFRADLEMACRAPGASRESTEILRTAFRLAFALTPEGFVGMASLGGVVVQTTTAAYPEYFKAGGWKALEVSEVRSAKSTIKAGESWELEAVLRSDRAQHPQSCFGTFSSDAFAGTIAKAREVVPFATCAWERIDDKTFRVKLAYPFVKGTPSRSYFIQSLGLTLEGSKLQLTGAPTFRHHVEVVSDSGTRPLRVSAVHFVLKRQGKQSTVGSFPDVSTPREVSYRLGDSMGLFIDVENALGINARSFVLGNFNFRASTAGPARTYLFPLHFRPVHEDLPFPNRIELHPMPKGGPLRVAISVGLSPHHDPYQIASIDWKTIYVLDSALNEALVKLPVTVRVEE